jgi:hypothetical protein
MGVWIIKEDIRFATVLVNERGIITDSSNLKCTMPGKNINDNKCKVQKMNLYIGNVNGELKYKKANTPVAAENALRAMALKRCGHADVNDIKLVRENVKPGRRNNNRPQRFVNKQVEYARPYKD